MSTDLYIIIQKVCIIALNNRESKFETTRNWLQKIIQEEERKEEKRREEPTFTDVLWSPWLICSQQILLQPGRSLDMGKQKDRGEGEERVLIWWNLLQHSNVQCKF